MKKRRSFVDIAILSLMNLPSLMVALQSSQVKVIVNEETYNKLKIKPTDSLEEQIDELLSKIDFPRYKFEVSCLAKTSTFLNGEEHLFHK